MRRVPGVVDDQLGPVHVHAELIVLPQHHSLMEGRHFLKSREEVLVLFLLDLQRADPLHDV